MLAVVMQMDRATRESKESALWGKVAPSTDLLGLLETVWTAAENMAPPLTDPPVRPAPPALTASVMDKAIKEQVLPKPIQGPKPIRTFGAAA